MRFEQAGVRVTDLERSVRFYTRTLGLRERRRGDTRGWGGGLWVLLEDPRSHGRIELNWYPEGSIFFTPYTPGENLDHLDFTLGVAPRSELERVYRRLVRAGAGRTPYEPATTEGWMACVTDPDGVWITVGRSSTPAERRAKAPPSPAPRRPKARRRR